MSGTNGTAVCPTLNSPRGDAKRASVAPDEVRPDPIGQLFQRLKGSKD